MKKISFCIIASILIFSCEKETNEQSKANENENFFSKLLTENVDSDFEVFTSFSAGDGLSNSPDSALKINLVIQANTEDLLEVGSLTVNAEAVPFIQSIGAHSLSLSSRDDSYSYTGNVNNYEFVSNSTGSIPSFSTNVYSPEATKLEFGGLVNNKLPVGSSLVVSWTPDISIPSDKGKAAIMVSAEDDLGENYVYDYIMIEDSDGEVTLNSSFMDTFQGYKYFSVKYFRGYNEPLTVNGKVIDFQFIGFTNTSILWEE
jgi:hypothetical protein